MRAKKTRAIGAAPKKQLRKSLRRPGRPSGVENSLLNRDTIFAIAFQLTKTVPLAELSIVRVARELGVTPALIHYYLGGRHALTSGVMNSFYRELVEQWPRAVGDWKSDIELAADAVYRGHVRYPGVASYVVSHNRYRMVQDVRDGEIDYGILFFERFISVVRTAGFDASRTVMYGHLLMDFITANAHATVRHRWPGEHGEFLNKKLGVLDPALFPGVHFVKDSLTKLNASTAFAIGMRLFLEALELERTAGNATELGLESPTKPRVVVA